MTLKMKAVFLSAYQHCKKRKILSLVFKSENSLLCTKQVLVSSGCS